MTIIKNTLGAIVGMAIGALLATIGFVVLVSDHYKTLEKEARKELERLKHPSSKTKTVSTETKDTYKVELPKQKQKYEWHDPQNPKFPKY
jgi:hypothetical protein